MKIVVIGGTGLIGSKVVQRLRDNGHDAIAASPASGVNTITGEGLAEVLSGANVVVDVANSPSFEDGAVMEFFQTAGRNVLAAEKTAGVGHHLALSVVGTDRIPESGYLRAKAAQEDLIRKSGVPFTILRSTQFYEFLKAIAEGGARGDEIRLSPALVQPIAAAEAAAALADLAMGPPRNAILEIAGPESGSLVDFAQRRIAAAGDRRRVVADSEACYFGAVLNDQSLRPDDAPLIGATRFDDWLKREAHGG
jgi:uncharacterized protein YbjT (DUF2867 family)